MTWARFDDGMLDNTKIAEAGVLGFALHVAAVIWCCRNLTDGKVPRARVTCLLDWSGVIVDTDNPAGVCGGESSSSVSTADPFTIADHLVHVGLWERAGANYIVHDFLHYNPSRAQVLSERERGKVRATKSREVRSAGAFGRNNGERSANVRIAFGSRHNQNERLATSSESDDVDVTSDAAGADGPTDRYDASDVDDTSGTCDAFGRNNGERSANVRIAFGSRSDRVRTVPIPIPYQKEKYKRHHSGESPPDAPSSPTVPNERESSVPAAAPKVATTRGSRLPADWRPSAETVAWCAAEGVDAVAVIPEFADHWRAVAGAKGTKLDWDATFRNRVRALQAQGRAPGLRAPSTPVPPPKDMLAEADALMGPDDPPSVSQDQPSNILDLFAAVGRVLP